VAARVENDSRLKVMSMIIAEPVPSNTYEPQSMNIAFRRREMNRINAENEIFVKVLKSVKTTMPREQWQHHIKYQKELQKLRMPARFKS
jgi:hypothetical protein